MAHAAQQHTQHLQIFHGTMHHLFMQHAVCRPCLPVPACAWGPDHVLGGQGRNRVRVEPGVSAHGCIMHCILHTLQCILDTIYPYMGDGLGMGSETRVEPAVGSAHIFMHWFVYIGEGYEQAACDAGSLGSDTLGGTRSAHSCVARYRRLGGGFGKVLQASCSLQNWGSG